MAAESKFEVLLYNRADPGLLKICWHDLHHTLKCTVRHHGDRYVSKYDEPDWYHGSGFTNKRCRAIWKTLNDRLWLWTVKPRLSTDEMT